MGCSCKRAVTVRPACHGWRVCVSPWVAVIVVLLFIVVLFTRCRAAASCAVMDVSRETSVATPQNEDAL